MFSNVDLFVVDPSQAVHLQSGLTGFHFVVIGFVFDALAEIMILVLVLALVMNLVLLKYKFLSATLLLTNIMEATQMWLLMDAILIQAWRQGSWLV